MSYSAAIKEENALPYNLTLSFYVQQPPAHLLVGHHAVGLQGGGMPAEQSRPWPVVFAENSPIDVVEAVTRDQAVPAGCAGKTLQGRK